MIGLVNLTNTGLEGLPDFGNYSMNVNSNYVLGLCVCEHVMGYSYIVYRITLKHLLLFNIKFIETS